MEMEIERMSEYFKFVKSNWRQVADKNPNADIPELMRILLNTWRKKQAKPNKEKETNSYGGKGLENPYLVEMCAADNPGGRVSESNSESEEELTEEQKETIYDSLPPSYRKSRRPKKPFVPPLKKMFPLCAALMKNNAPKGLESKDKVITVQSEAHKDDGDKKESFVDLEEEVEIAGSANGNIIEQINVNDADTQVEDMEEAHVLVDEDYGTTDKASYDCNKCGKNYKQLKSSKDHQCAILSKVPCPSCTKLISKTNISHHMKTHFSGKKLKCGKCNLSFNSAHEKQEHLKSKLHNGCACHTCGKVFRRPCLLKEHMKIHSDENSTGTLEQKEEPEKKYYCKFCYQKFGSVTILQNHLTKEHPQLGKKCTQCSNIYFSKRSLVRHTQLHELINLKQAKTAEQVKNPSQEVMLEVIID